MKTKGTLGALLMPMMHAALRTLVRGEIEEPARIFELAGIRPQ